MKGDFFFLKKMALVCLLGGLSYLPAKHLRVTWLYSFGVEAGSYVDYGFGGMMKSIFAMAIMFFIIFFLFFQEHTVRLMESIDRRVGLGFFLVSLAVIVCLFSWPVRAVFLKRIEGFVECKELRSGGMGYYNHTYAIDDVECRRLVQAKRGL